MLDHPALPGHGPTRPGDLGDSVGGLHLVAPAEVVGSSRHRELVQIDAVHACRIAREDLALHLGSGCKIEGTTLLASWDIYLSYSDDW